MIGELDRRVRLTLGISQPAATALAVIDGAGAPLTPSQGADRVLIPSATVTATLDLLERRGWVRRAPNPDDRVQVQLPRTANRKVTAPRYPRSPSLGLRQVSGRRQHALNRWLVRTGASQTY